MSLYEGAGSEGDGSVDINNQPALERNTANWRACFMILDGGWLAHMEAGAADEERPLIQHLPPEEQCSQYTCDGTVNSDKKPALKQSTGNWRACFFILGAQFAETLCFFMVSKNLVTYLTSALHESNIDAAQSVSIWIGTSFFTPLIGAFLADTYWGRYWTTGMLIVTVTSSPLFLNSSYYNWNICRATVYTGLYLTAIGSGCMKPCIPAFGADQFDSADPVERLAKGSFFNWYYFSMNVGSLLSTTLLVWVVANIGWSVGFAIPMLLSGFGLALFFAGRKVYRYKKQGGSPLTRVSQVVVAAVRNHRLKLPDDSSLLHEVPKVTEDDYRTQLTTQFRFFDKAAILSDEVSAAQSSPWRLCTVSQVEELKMLLRMFPVWVSMVIFFVVTAQITSTLIEQGMAMDGRVGPFTLPAASIATFDVISVLVWVPVYDTVLVPLARRVTGKDRGISHLQRIGVGLALAAVAMAYSAVVEARRLGTAPAPTSIMWQAPSYLVLGVAEAFSVIGMMEFFYEQSPESMKSLCTALGQLAIAVANYLNSGVLSVVAAATTRGGGAGWIPDNLDEGHLDYFFWMMALTRSPSKGCQNDVFKKRSDRKPPLPSVGAQKSQDWAFARQSPLRGETARQRPQEGEDIVEQCSEYTCDGTVDIDKRPALKHNTGNWRACFFILGAEFTQCLCFSAVVKNLVRYLTSVLHESNVNAARSVSTWIGTCFFTPLIGAFLADTFWGRYRTIVICLSVYTIGMLILTTSASLPFLLHDSYNNGDDIRRVVAYLGLYLIALGAGGIKPCMSALGADQFDGADPVERVTKGSFFNYYYFSNNMGTLLSTTVLVWVQDNIGWGIGFATPMLLMGFGLSMFVAGRRVYRYRKLGRSPLTRVSQVVVAAARNHMLKLPDDISLLHELPSLTEGGYRIQHTTRFRFLDKAAIPSDSDDNSPVQPDPWRLCTVSQVEELKMLLRVFPVWASLLVFFVVTAQMSSTLIEQSAAMDGRVGPFTVPPASLATFNVVAVLIWVPVYDAVLVPLARRATGNDRGLSHLQRIGVGLALSAVAMAYSAQVERRRRRPAAEEEAMSIMWQAPCYLVLGMAEVFTSIGMLEFFYERSPGSMKSLGTSLAHLAVATANYLNSGVLGVVVAATTRGGGAGWIPDNLDEGHLDYFFWMMALVSVLNLLQFLHCSIRDRGQ
uniref:Major facilitator superfamily (MFS) profile domain-containing protein n=1 Tax=Oryza barthii TaxID=65489 RepID=A0A0D3HAI9_9ORYZ